MIEFQETLFETHSNLLTIMVGHNRRIEEADQYTSQDNVIDIRGHGWKRAVRDDVIELQESVEELVQIACA